MHRAEPPRRTSAVGAMEQWSNGLRLDRHLGATVLGDDCDDIDASGLFEVIDINQYDWQREYDAEATSSS
jgi:hypothetical protein